MQYLLVFVAVLLVGAVAFLAVGRRRGDAGPEIPRGGLVLGLAEPVPSLPAVLLPERPTAEDIALLRLGVGLRGYRCDQVDEVLAALADEIERLNDELAATRHGSVISTTNHSPE
ncbi:DivIVA domain-containing protein [Arthrobacter sp. JSM 101049]|uniref:DivIVA domain-containing protein n=1 Tax=Arthrobacter sp. JSM 101049 TaxID=929097 RepID=UPI00356752BD